MVKIDRQVLLDEAIDLLILLILCADICLSILMCHAYVMSEIARRDEIIMSRYTCVMLMKVCVWE